MMKDQAEMILLWWNKLDLGGTLCFCVVWSKSINSAKCVKNSKFCQIGVKRLNLPKLAGINNF